MSAVHGIETWLVRALAAGVAALPWRRSLALGAALGDAARRLGIRRRVAEENLACAFPEWSPARRADVLREHYRELGRVACEYPRLPELARTPLGDVVAEVEGVEHLRAAKAGGRGAIVMTGHFGNFELMGAFMSREHPVDFVVRPLSNPGVEALITRWRSEAGVGVIPLGAGVRRVFAALEQNRWVAFLADQDARSRGVFVPFLGRSSSTAAGPAQIALRTGAPLVMGFITRRADGRHAIRLLPALEPPDPRDPEAARIFTARHTACLESWVRAHPAMWLWLHRRWKTGPAERHAPPTSTARAAERT